MTNGLGLAGLGNATTTGWIATAGFLVAAGLALLIAAAGAGLALLIAATGAGLVFLSAAAGFGLGALAAAAGFTRFAATAERAGGLEGLEAFLSGAAGRLLVRALPTEPRDAFENFAIIRRRRDR